MVNIHISYILSPRLQWHRIWPSCCSLHSFGFSVSNVTSVQFCNFCNPKIFFWFIAFGFLKKTKLQQQKKNIQLFNVLDYISYLVTDLTLLRAIIHKIIVGFFLISASFRVNSAIQRYLFHGQVENIACKDV